MNKDDYAVYTDRMQKTLDVMQANFAAVRAGRANAAVLDQIRVDYYGTPTPINQIASIASPDPRTLTIQPWDAGTMKLIEKAIQASDLGINPQNDGRLIRLAFPQLTEERRKANTARRARPPSATSAGMPWMPSRSSRRSPRSLRTT